jgi:hypothetical protein
MHDPSATHTPRHHTLLRTRYVPFYSIITLILFFKNSNDQDFYKLFFSILASDSYTSIRTASDVAQRTLHDVLHLKRKNPK